MNAFAPLDPHALLQRVAAQVPPALRGNVVVIGSIAAAWAFRDVSGAHSVATKDIDLLLRPAVDAVATAQMLGQELLADGWQPQFTQGRAPGDASTPDDELPALRLSPPSREDGWFVELLAESPQGQATRKHWRRFETPLGAFGLASFRYMRVAVYGADESAFGLRVARPACMALAHLLEHAEPDRTPISSLHGHPPRFVKDVGRAISLWWLARQQSPLAAERWRDEWRAAQAALYANEAVAIRAAARAGLNSVDGYLYEAHAIAMQGLLAPHGTTLDAYRRAYESLAEALDRL